MAGCGDNNKDKVKIEVSGNKPKSGKVTITNGQVTITSKLDMGDYDVTYDSENKKYTASEKGSTPSSTVVYRWSEDDINIGDTINHSDTSKFTKDASTLGKSNYLKHVLDKDDKVIESYACAILKGNEYCIRGGKDNNGNSFYGYTENENDYTGNALILKQIEAAKIEVISCSITDDGSYCRDDSGDLFAYSFGSVVARVDGYCGVGDDGTSSCGS